MGCRKYSFIAAARKQLRSTPWKLCWYLQQKCCKEIILPSQNERSHNIPKVCFVELLHVQRLIVEWSYVQVSSRRKHFTCIERNVNQTNVSQHLHAKHTARFKPFLGVQERLEHPFVEKHVAHRLGDNDVHFFWQLDFFDFPSYNLDLIQPVELG